MQHKQVGIAGPAGRLEGLYRIGEPGLPAVLVCHPHPQFGGTMRNKVVYWMARSFEDLGLSVLRFNFRGVGNSEGAWDEAIGEVEDAAACIDWLAERHAGSRLWVAGFSFGSYAGLKAAQRDSRVSRMFAVAPAVNHWDFSFLEKETRPVTIVSGTADEIVPFGEVEQWVRTLSSASFHAIEGAGHFFPEHMGRMRELLLSGIRV